MASGETAVCTVFNAQLYCFQITDGLKTGGAVPVEFKGNTVNFIQDRGNQCTGSLRCQKAVNILDENPFSSGQCHLFCFFSIIFIGVDGAVGVDQGDQSGQSGGFGPFDGFFDFRHIVTRVVDPVNSGPCFGYGFAPEFRHGIGNISKIPEYAPPL